jgi:hypothetical protein
MAYLDPRGTSSFEDSSTVKAVKAATCERSAPAHRFFSVPSHTP